MKNILTSFILFIILILISMSGLAQSKKTVKKYRVDSISIGNDEREKEPCTVVMTSDDDGLALIEIKYDRKELGDMLFCTYKKEKQTGGEAYSAICKGKYCSIGIFPDRYPNDKLIIGIETTRYRDCMVFHNLRRIK